MSRQFGKFRAWDQAPDQPLAVDEIVNMYERGFAGAYGDPEADEALRAEQAEPDGETLCQSLGWADTARGQLVTTWLHVDKQYPGCWPANNQQRGDCVSHNARNAGLTTHVGEIVAGKPDPVSGKLEGPVEVSTRGRTNGVFATEPHYRYRGHRGDGDNCGSCIRVLTRQCGAVIRKNYPGVADLENYNPKWAGGAWNGAESNAERDAFDDHLYIDSTTLDSFEAVRDMLARGIGISSCGSEGFAKTRDENGVSRRSGSWAHAMAFIGADDRPEIHRRYGGPLVLVLNSWGPRWNSGSRKVMGTEYLIPEGSFWARWSDLRRRSIHAIGGLNGWERELKMVDWDPGWG